MPIRPLALTSTTGKPWGQDGPAKRFQQAKKKAGITEKRFKDLRGTAASYFSGKGLSYAEVGVILSWSEKNVETIACSYINRDKLPKATVTRLKKNK